MDLSNDTEVGDLLARFGSGDAVASEKLLALVYSELHAMASACMRGQPPGHTLQATALVNEAYLRLASQREHAWQSRAHLLCTAARAMRCVLVDHARTRRARQRDARVEASALDQIVVTYEDRAIDLLALEQALTELAQFDPMMARAVELRFFGGLQVGEVARVLHVRRRTLERYWQVTRAWLLERMG